MDEVPIADGSRNALSSSVSVMVGPYNQAIPLIIASVAVGTSIVNRTPLKLAGHLLGAIFVGLIAALVAHKAGLSESACNFVIAFLGYTVGYVYTCFKNGIPDAFIITGISVGFAVLLGLNMATSAMSSGLGSVYLFTTLVSIGLGVGGVYAASALWGSPGVYDFKGCSCDDCANANQCPSKSGDGSGPKMFARRIS